MLLKIGCLRDRTLVHMPLLLIVHFFFLGLNVRLIFSDREVSEKKKKIYFSHMFCMVINRPECFLAN